MFSGCYHHYTWNNTAGSDCKLMCATSSVLPSHQATKLACRVLYIRLLLLFLSRANFDVRFHANLLLFWIHAVRSLRLLLDAGVGGLEGLINVCTTNIQGALGHFVGRKSFKVFCALVKLAASF